MDSGKEGDGLGKKLEALRLAESKLRTTLSSIGDAVLTTDSDGRVDFLNPVAEQLTGWSLDEARGRPVEEVFCIVNENTRVIVKNPVERVLTEGVVVGLANHTILIAKDGREFPIADSGAPIKDDDGVLLGTVLVFRDQSRERAEQGRIQRALEFSDGILDTARHPFVVLDQNLHVVRTNRAFHELFHIPGEQCMGTNLFDLSDHQFDLPGLRSLLEDILPQNSHFDDFELRATIRPIGQRILILNARRLRLESVDHPDRILLGIEDVTEHRQAVVRLKKLNQILYAIRNVNQLITSEKDPRRLVTRSCELLTKDGGYTTAWAMLRISNGKHAPAFLTGVGLECDVTSLSAAFANDRIPPCVKRAHDTHDGLVELVPGNPLCDHCPQRAYPRESYGSLKILRHGNDELGVLFAALPPGQAIDEEMRGLFKEVAGDIAFGLHAMAATRLREQAVEELRRSEERFRAIFEDALDGIVISDIHTGEILMANPAMARMLGLRCDDDLVGCSIQGLVIASARQRVLDGITAQIDGSAPLAREVPLANANGTVVFCDVHAVPVVLDEMPVLVSVYRDITEKRALQASLAQSDRLASMGMLAAGVAHEINNPLSYVIYNLETLVEDFSWLIHDSKSKKTESGNSLPLDDLLDRAREALKGVNRIKDIARGLGTFSRVEQDEKTLVELHDAMEHAINMAFNEIKYRARLVKDFGMVPPVLASEGRLAQVFLNLLINAAHAMDDGDAEHNEIRVRTWAEGEHAFIEVSDTGTGIAPGDMHRLFEPFFTTKPAGVGTGLGLSISKKIITDLGGEISVHSELGKGSRFVVRIPALRDDTSPLNAEDLPEHRETAHKGGRILVVDDEALIRKALRRMLEKRHEVVTVESATEARQLLEKDHDFELIVCDMIMPHFSGVDLHQWLARVQADLAERVLFITGGAFTPKARQFLKEVDNPRIEKPFDVKKLIRMVDEMVLAARAKG